MAFLITRTGTVAARRGPAAQAEAEFTQLVTKRPEPVSSEPVTDQRTSIATNGESYMLGYIGKLNTPPETLTSF